MGSDFVMGYVVIPIRKCEDFERVRKKLRTALKKHTITQEEADAYYEPLTGEDAPKDMKEVRKEFANAINEGIKALQGRRDVTFIEHKGDRIYTTGGMSWGDDPTEAYRIFENLLRLPQKILKASKVS